WSYSLNRSAPPSVRRVQRICQPDDKSPAPDATPVLRPLPGDQCCLADFDQVAVGVAHVAAKLNAAVCRCCQELGASRSPLLVDAVDVGDADVEEAADS